MTPLEAQLEKMYRKVSDGKREGPDLDRMPRPLGTMLDESGQERRVYPVKPAVYINNTTTAYVTFKNTQPDPAFWESPVV